MNSKCINVFDKTERKIMCIAKEHDYLGDGTKFVEEKLEVGSLYTLEDVQIHSYGMVVYLQEIDSKYGFMSYLFEELEEHDLEIFKCNYNEWLGKKLEESLEDVEKGRVEDAEVAFKSLKEKYGLI